MMSRPQDDAHAPAGGATAIAAGVLGMVGGLFWGVMAYSALVSLAHRSDGDRIEYADDKILVYPAGTWVGWPALIEAVLATTLLLPGAALLLMRKLAGRLLIVLGCAVAIVSIFRPIVTGFDYEFGHLITACGVTLFPVLTVVLALAPSTRTWCQSSG